MPCLVNGKARLAPIPEVMVRISVLVESNRSFGRVIRMSTQDFRVIRNDHFGGIGTLLAKNIEKLSQFTSGNPGKT
jgi:hypothetical protein